MLNLYKRARVYREKTAEDFVNQAASRVKNTVIGSLKFNPDKVAIYKQALMKKRKIEETRMLNNIFSETR